MHPFLFHAVTSLHPPSFHRNDFPHVISMFVHTMETLNNGQLEDEWFVHFRLSLIYSEVEMYGNT